MSKRPALSRSLVRERLARAEKDRELVRIVRGIKRADRVKGYVLAVGRRWTLLALEEDAYLNGFTAVRVRDIVDVRDSMSDRFVMRALELRGEWPPTPPAALPALNKTRELIGSCGNLAPLVALYMEYEYPDEIYIGVPVGWGKKSVRLLEVMPQARWDEVPEKYKLASISRVDFGGRYEQALTAVAGPAPLPPLTD